MPKTEQLSRLIGDIYDAALDPSLWICVLRQAAGFVGGAAASIYAKDLGGTAAANIICQHGLDPAFVQLYTHKYVQRVPASGYFTAGVEEPLSTADIVGCDELVKTRFYKQWMRPQSLVDSLHVLLDKSATSGTAFVVFRHARDGLVRAEARARMQLIAPHIRRAALIGKVVDAKTAEAATFADTLDGLAAGMFVVDARGRIIHANASGRAMLDDGCVLHAAGGKLGANDTRAEHALHEVFLAAGNGDDAVGGKGVAVPLIARNQERYVAHVLPLASGARRRAGARYGAIAAAFVHKATLAAPTACEVIAKAYGLTPTELRVLLAVLEVGGVPEVADALGIAETTVKTHLGRLFQKTGTGRQADLVKLVAGFVNPLGG